MRDPQINKRIIPNVWFIVVYCGLWFTIGHSPIEMKMIYNRPQMFHSTTNTKVKDEPADP